MLHNQILTVFTIFKVNGWYVKFCYFGVFFPHYGLLVSSLGTTEEPFELNFPFYYPHTVFFLAAGHF